MSTTRSEISHPDEWQEWYLAVEDGSYWFRHRAACIVESLRRFSPPGPVFDVGGGNGHVSLAMKRAGFEPVLVEPSVQAAENAQRRGLEPILCATLQDAGLLPGSVPALGAFDVLEHIEDDAGFLRLIEQTLRPGGLVLLTVPAFNVLWSGHDEYVGHYRRYTLRGLSALLQAAGFVIEFKTYLFAILPLPIFVQRSIPTRLGLTRQSSFERFQKEHATQRGWGVQAVERLLQQELAWLRRGRAIPFGSSCLIVARKPPPAVAVRQAA